MRRVVASSFVFAGLLAGCDAVEANRTAIEESCLANGDTPEVCSCLASETAERVDPAVLDLIAIGARGETREASERIKALDAPLRSQLSIEVPAIMAECGMDRS